MTVIHITRPSHKFIRSIEKPSPQLSGNAAFINPMGSSGRGKTRWVPGMCNSTPKKYPWWFTPLNYISASSTSVQIEISLNSSEFTLRRTRISLVVMSLMLACDLCTTHFLADKGPTALKEIYPGIDLLRFLWCVVLKEFECRRQ